MFTAQAFSHDHFFTRVSMTYAASFSDPIMGEPSGPSQREARIREEHQTTTGRESRQALDPTRPNREEPQLLAD